MSGGRGMQGSDGGPWHCLKSRVIQSLASAVGVLLGHDLSLSSCLAKSPIVIDTGRDLYSLFIIHL